MLVVYVLYGLPRVLFIVCGLCGPINNTKARLLRTALLASPVLCILSRFPFSFSVLSLLSASPVIGLWFISLIGQSRLAAHFPAVYKRYVISFFMLIVVCCSVHSPFYR